MRILGLSGSLRRDSHNTRLLRGAGALLPAGRRARSCSTGSRAIPPVQRGRGAASAARAVAALKAAIAAADAVLLATPEYNASIPGGSRTRSTGSRARSPTTPLRGKPAAVIGASTGLFGAVWAQAEARKVLGTIGARVVDRELPIGQAEEALGEDGLPLEPDVRQRALERPLAELVALAGCASGSPH